MRFQEGIALFEKGCLLLAAGILFLFSACRPGVKPEDPDNFTGFYRPEYFPPPVYRFENNPLTEEGFELGRRLFYDPVLSKDGTISCAGCHHQAAGFSDPGKALSQGVAGKTGKRNSPALANLAWYPSFMWDGGINHIEVMPVAPITDSLEMSETLWKAVAKLQEHPDYPALFEKAFGSSVITDQKMLFALAQFMSLMISDNSRYDRRERGKVHFTEKEQKGLAVFNRYCGSCHSGPLQTDFSFRNNGLGADADDEGRFRITRNEADRGKFKVPGLRNVVLTAPYMHNGQLASLEAVLDHYTSDIQRVPGLDPELQAPIVLSPEERRNLLAFLETLTDHDYIQNKRLSQP